MKKIFNSVSLCLCGGLIIFFSSVVAQAQEKWVFLPASPLFSPLIADPLEPLTSVIAHTNELAYEGRLGTTVEFIRYEAADKTRWGWGAFGSGAILLGEEGATFPMKAADWTAGMYLSEASGAFSHRLEFLHQSAHLGDSFQGIQIPIFYSRENFNWTSSFTPCDYFRLHVGIGAWENMAPEGKAFFASLGTEIYSPPVDFLGTFLRAYGTAHFKWEDEAGGVLDKTFQLGFQWKFKKEESRALRIALVYYDGNSEYGQFYFQREEHAGIGVYFDP